MFLFPDIGLIVLATIATAVLSFLWLSRQGPAHDSASPGQRPPEALLFENGILHHASQDAGLNLGLNPGDHDWSDLRDNVLARFPDFPKHLDDAGTTRLTAIDNDMPRMIEIMWQGDLRWVTLFDDFQEGAEPLQETAALERASQTAPYPVWQENDRSEVTWYNPAYAKLYEETYGAEVDPHKRLFSSGDPDVPTRVALSSPDSDTKDWYELTAVDSGPVTVFHATGINAVIAAEDTQRNFVQTLAKTFAHLSIGLAIFDRKGQLVLFNPALLDLTGLSAPFLSGRPAMLSFFDALRENRRMPEPKNYRSWRQEIADLIAAATDGRYQETWTLETGQTYNVTGRQHPDGATAFLIEDISAEMTLTRNFRIDLEQAQFMIDAVDVAMAIFSPSGVLTISNTSFHKTWGIDPDSAFADVTLHDCTRIWKSTCVLATDLAILDRALSRVIVGVPQDVVFAQRKRDMRCTVTHLPSGSVLVQFRPQPTEKKPRGFLAKETA